MSSAVVIVFEFAENARWCWMRPTNSVARSTFEASRAPAVTAARPPVPALPTAAVPLSRVYGYQPGDVFGVQGQMWSEYTPTPELVEYRTFPRLAAIAELGWTAPQPRDFAGFRGRLAGHLARLDRLGVNYRPLD